MLKPEFAKYFLPIVLILIVGEAVLYAWRRKKFPYKEALTSLMMFVVYQVSSFGTFKVLSPLFSRIADFRIASFDMSLWWHWVTLFFGLEFFYYWMHRMSHEVRWLWASHSVHHSPHTITFSGAYRLSITNLVSGTFLFFTPLYLIGYPVWAVTGMLALNLFYQFWLHTETIPRLGFLEGIFNTPSNHRVHHSIEPEYIDKNHGGVLIIFDRIFGTYAAEKVDKPMRYGLIGKAQSFNPFKLFFQEWVALIGDLRKARTWLGFLKACFGSPGSSFKANQDPLEKDDGQERLNLVYHRGEEELSSGR